MNVFLKGSAVAIFGVLYFITLSACAPRPTDNFNYGHEIIKYIDNK